jgi:KDEL-tailed cysteine endopeptidase
MRALVLVALLSVSALALTEQEYQTSFVNWMRKFDKSYQPEDFFYRFGVFKEMVDYVNAHNAANYSWSAGLNQFSDLTSEEFGRMYASGYKPWKSGQPASNGPAPNTYPTGTVMWTTTQNPAGANVVNAIQNQGQCGSCWAFSATATIESWIRLTHGTLPKLSEEELVECVPIGDGCQGCNGGSFEGAGKWVHTNGQCSESSYPYTSSAGVTGSCKGTSSCAAVAYTTAITTITALNGGENAIGATCDHEPVNIAVEADQKSFQSYTTGIFCPTALQCGTNLDHAIVVVGYSTSSTGTPYWQIRNSWGTTWGEAGYMQMCRNQNCCGIANAPGYVTPEATV